MSFDEIVMNPLRLSPNYTNPGIHTASSRSTHFVARWVLSDVRAGLLKGTGDFLNDMEYKHLPNLNQTSAEQLVYNETAKPNQCRDAVLWIVRFGDPKRAIEVVYDLIDRGSDELAYAGVSLLDLPITFGELSPDLSPVKTWMFKYSAEKPTEAEKLKDILELIEMAIEDSKAARSS